MWTPRRVGLLVLGVALFVAAYLGYSLALGGFDGLPAIPDGYLKRAAPGAVPTYPVSDTIWKLQQAFGPDSPEAGTSLEYRNRLQLDRQDGVIACGSPVTDGSPTVVVAPISAALFGKPPARPRPGEVPDISTFHADRAVLKFDRPIAKVDEMFTAKVVNVELVSEPDDDPQVPTEKKDKRKGRIWLSSNRKSPDPADHVVVRTAGPVFVELPDESVQPDPNVPQVQTTALVEVFDRRNLPRKLRSRDPRLAHRTAVTEITENVPPVAALARPDDLRKHGAIADILTGSALPPPTVTARGMKVFFAPAKKKSDTPRTAGRTASFSGVREIVLSEQVQMNLWTDGSNGFPGGGAPAAKTDAQPPAPNADPPLGALAVVGGLLDAGTLVSRMESRSLLLIETPGAFTFNLEKDLATFDVAALPLPEQQNYVVATHLTAKNQTDYLVCSKLILDLADPNKGGAKGGPATVGAPEPPDDGAFVIRDVTALGPQVYVSFQADGLEASGSELRYTRDAKARRSVTVLKGNPRSPVVAKRDGSKLSAGGDAADAVVQIIDTETEVKGKVTKETVVSVVGPGRLEMVDRAGGGPTGVAQWGKSLKHEKTTQDGRPVDLLKFEENAAFADPSSGFSLTGRSIWLWVSDGDKDKGKPKAVAADDGKRQAIGAVPERLVATGDVHLDSEDLVVRRNDKLTVWFRDVAPPAVVHPEPVAKADPPVVPQPTVPPAPGEQPKVAQAEPPKPKEPEKKPIPNPMYLDATTVETWVVRYPVPPTAPLPSGAAPTDKRKLKYEMEKARCEDNVRVEQAPDPNDPSKPANGILILGNKLTLDHAPPAGSVLTVVGGHPREQWATVSFEGTTVFAQTVVIDQPNNELWVDGPGRLRSLTASDVAGNDLSNPSDLVVDWKTRMRFEGAKPFARFLGGVVVDQLVQPDPTGKPAAVAAPGAERLPPPRDAGPVNATVNQSNVWCNQLDLTLDRPVYFNQLRKDDRNKAANPDRKGGGDGRPKDTAAQKDGTGGRPKLKRVVALPNDDADAPALERVVVYRETAFAADGSKALVRGRMLTARQMDFANRTKDEDWVKLDAAGPGELRILQAEASNDPAPAADPAARVAAKPPTADQGEVKLTVVNFQAKMAGRDKGNGVYQDARFDDGAVVMSVPTAAIVDVLDAAGKKLVKDRPEALLAAGVEPHALPKGSVYLTCKDVMTVSSTRGKRDAPADQRLTAKGDSQFRDDSRTGTGDTIRYDGTRVTLEGAGGRLATLMANRQGPNAEQSTRARKFVYNSKTKLVEVSETSGGSFSGR